MEPAIKSSNNALVSGTGGVRLESLADHRVANESPPLRHLFEMNCVARRRSDEEIGPPNLLHASHNAVSQWRTLGGSGVTPPLFGSQKQQILLI